MAHTNIVRMCRSSMFAHALIFAVSANNSMVARATPFSATFRCFRRLLRQSHTRSASNGAARTKKHGSVPLPSRYDVCIVGGGVMGSASAFFLASRMPRKSVCVIERDFSVSTRPN